ncbi:MAG: NADPH-dependent 2,4-dienoyl-CoA reductase/sulfur reductase-like enzyme [Planctomycetota bacterium]|jgi:NADPH-dependent 2,4-dienoyl-CoA reductase/sulfur reductase-like enzyme
MHVVVIGNGAAGVSAVFRIRKHHPDWQISMISGESKFHYSRPALMYIYMGHMRYRDTKPYEDDTWAKKNITLVRDWVTNIDTNNRTLTLHKNKAIKFDRLIISTGSKPNKFGWPGQDLKGVQGLWGLYDLKNLKENAERAKKAVIVGGGLIGIELAEMLHSQGVHVVFLVREKSYWSSILPAEESQLVNEVIREEGIELRLGTELKEILDDGQGRVSGIVTTNGEQIDCQVVGLTAGVSPNIDMIKDTDIATGRGILVNQQLQTSDENVWAAGDCAEIVTPGDGRNTINQVWYTAKMQGEVVGDNVSDISRNYAPPLWYNSAKFFDLEYHTYGQVNIDRNAERYLVWQHPSEKKLIRIVHNKTNEVIGIQTMGIRFRHRVCEQWINDQRSPEFVLKHLEEANFDPEFYQRHENEIRAAFEGVIS